MPRKRPHRPATLLAILLALHLTRLHGVAGRFRGADHKPIPTLGDNGAVQIVRAGVKTNLVLRKLAPVPIDSGFACGDLLYYVDISLAQTTPLQPAAKQAERPAKCRECVRAG